MKRQKNKTPKDQDEQWMQVFKMFYDDNETGGSSRWLVTPDTVLRFIKGLLRERDDRFGNKNE